MTEMVPVPSVGRLYVRERSVRLGDVNPSGVQRLDSVARFVQDIATADAMEALDGSAFAYVLRKLSIGIERSALLGERLTLTTFCGGTARGWAERRTSIRGERGAVVETSAVWVPIDAEGRPVRLPPDFLDAYGEAAQGRRADARLVHDAPPSRGARHRPWPLRYVDLDTLGHVNNTAQWCAAEEILRGKPVARADIEFVSVLNASEPCELVVLEPAPGGERVDLWLCGEGHVRSSMRVWLAE
jgi:acyl-ACP thioesterase